MFEGALLKYLESKLYFGMLITTAEKEDVEHLRERSKEVANLLASEKTDNSIGILFSQMADAALHPTGDGEPSAAQIRRAVVILNIVMPAYSDYVKGSRP